MSKLYIIATPIGNLKDISYRAIEMLQEVDLILAEDTRVTGKLLKEYDIKTNAISFHQHSNSDRVIKLIAKGKNLALVSDAGTPGVNDPGGKLIEEILKSRLNVEIIPIPGASALTSILSVAGIQLENFEYKGFVPHKKGKETYLKYISDSKIPVVFFESTHRMIKTLMKLNEINPDKNLIVGRELTKLHETIYRGKVEEIINQLESTSTKGEFVIIAY